MKTTQKCNGKLCADGGAMACVAPGWCPLGSWSCVTLWAAPGSRQYGAAHGIWHCRAVGGAGTAPSLAVGLVWGSAVVHQALGVCCGECSSLKCPWKQAVVSGGKKQAASNLGGKKRLLVNLGMECEAPDVLVGSAVCVWDPCADGSLLPCLPLWRFWLCRGGISHCVCNQSVLGWKYVPPPCLEPTAVAVGGPSSSLPAKHPILFWGSLGISPLPLLVGSRVMLSIIPPRSHIWPLQGSKMSFFGLVLHLGLGSPMLQEGCGAAIWSFCE